MSVGSSLIEAVAETKVRNIRILTNLALFASTFLFSIAYVHSEGSWSQWIVTIGAVLSNNEFAKNTKTDIS